MTERDDKGTAAYVRSVTEGTRAYVREVHEDLERTRAELLAVQAERDKLAGQLEAVKQQLEACIPRQPSVAPSNPAKLEAAKRLDEERFLQLERQNSHLANLYVASYQLHETLTRAEVLAIAQEIITNLIGSEEHAIFEVDPSDQKLKLCAAVGVDEAVCAALPADKPEVQRALASGDAYLSDKPTHQYDPGPHGITACVPLKVAGRPTGVIVVYSILTQKAGFEDNDRELFALLGSHAGMALYCTRLHEERSRAEKSHL